MSENMPVYDWEDAVEYIVKRCELNKDTVEKVLLFEEEYMRSVGIISEDNKK